MDQPGVQELKANLRRLFEYELAVLFGRGRAGLVAMIEETTAHDTPVVIPSNICTAVLAAVLATRRKPLVVSVSGTTGLVDDGELALVIDRHDGAPGLAVVTHLYGMLADYPLTVAAARHRGWRLLEDDSLAATATRRGGGPKIGEALLVSFGGGKVLDGGGGGAVLTNDRALAAALARRAAQWPAFNSAAERIETSITLARRHIGALGIPESSEAILQVESMHCRHAFDVSKAEPLAATMDHFQADGSRRMDRLGAWQVALAELRDVIQVPPIPVRSAWRAVFRVADGLTRDRIVQELRSQGIDVGTNYPPLWSGAPKLLGGQRQAGGDLWGASVMTLWVIDAYDESRIQGAADVVRRVVDR